MKHHNSRFPIVPVAGLVLAIFASSTAQAADQRSRLRGTFSFSQMVPSTTLLTGKPLPLVAVGTLKMDDTNHFTGHGVFNTPVPGQQVIELDMNGECTARAGKLANGLDCVFNFPAFNLSNVGRYCVVMANTYGRCFDEFRCVDTAEPGETVALIEYKRQHVGTCD